MLDYSKVTEADIEYIKSAPTIEEAGNRMREVEDRLWYEQVWAILSDKYPTTEKSNVP